MGDIFLDLRPITERQPSRVASALKFFDDIHTEVIEREEFSLVYSRPDNLDLWSAYESPDGNLLVALAGRIALTAQQWEQAKKEAGRGGWACKHIASKYCSGDEKALAEMNGHYLILIYDCSARKIVLAVDRCGMVPCFQTATSSGSLLFSTHPDILAEEAGQSQKWDRVAMAEFLMTGKLSFPYTYYESVRTLDFGSLHTIDLSGERPALTTSKKYFEFNYNIDTKTKETEIAERLAEAFKNAMNKRSLPLFGTTAMALSGGLDSRALLCSIADRGHVKTFCFFDEENLEYQIAKQIAQTAGVELIPLKRDFDHYGGAAAKGIEISGGMGGAFNNHFLGFRDTFKQLGFENLITGFYCDYYFKALALDRHKVKWLQHEKLGEYQYEWYRPCFWPQSSYLPKVRARLDEVIPPAMQQDRSDTGYLRVVEKRVFPLCYEPDHLETTVPQRVMPWYLPMTDNDVLDVYVTIPPQTKMNISMYSKMVAMACGPEITRIPNINTGARVDASKLNLLWHRYVNAVRNRFEKHIAPKLALSGSWPNWQYYIHHSERIASLWQQDSETAKDLFQDLLGYDPYAKPIDAYRGNEVDFFSRLLTLKIWLDQRAGKKPE